MTIRKKSRGRPPQHHSKIDHGTTELQQKRKTLLAAEEGQNMTLAGSLLGILYGRHLISQPLYEAGCFFGELGYRYEACLGYKLRPNSSSLSFNDLNRRGSSPLLWSDRYIEKRTRAWREALNALEQAGPQSYKMVLKVVFYDQDLYESSFPHFLTTTLNSLRKGLESLDLYFKEGSQGVKGKHSDRGLSHGRSTTFSLSLKENQSLSPG